MKTMVNGETIKAYVKDYLRYLSLNKRILE